MKVLKAASLLQPRNLGLVLALLLAILVPMGFGSDYIFRVGTSFLLLAILAANVDLVFGYTGQMTFGVAGMYLVGAYTSALLTMKLDLPVGLAILASGLTAALFGWVVGFISFRFKGLAFTILTFAFAESIRIITEIAEPLTRGPLGLVGIPRPAILPSTQSFYYFALVLLVVILILLWYAIRSNLGKVFLTIREDQLLASSLGVDIFKYKLLSFIISSFFVGIAGAVYAHWMTVIVPGSFTLQISLSALLAVLLIAPGTLWGPVAGALVLTVLNEALSYAGHPELQTVAYGALLITIIMIGHSTAGQRLKGAWAGLTEGRRQKGAAEEGAVSS